MKFHRLIKKLRTDKGISIKQLAPILGLDYSYISKLENDRSKPSAELLTKMANYYEYDKDLLFLAAGKIPEDIQEILNSKPEKAIELLRREFGTRR
jgi:transcriptional regulator with XRE-family HTH domain